MRLEHRKLALEPQHRRRNQCPLRQHARIRDHEPRGEIIRAVANDIVTSDDVERVVGAQPQPVGFQFDVGIDRRCRVRRPRS